MAYNFRNVNVLVVESSEEMFKLIKNVLSIFSVPDANIYAAYNIEEGFAKYCKIKHDLVIVDWLQNPDRGIQLTKIIRTNPKTPNQFVPIIMTAGSGHLQRVLKARDAGISEYLVKPFSAKSLADRVSRVIEKPRQFVVSPVYVGPDRRVRSETYTGPERREEKQGATKTVMQASSR